MKRKEMNHNLYRRSAIMSFVTAGMFAFMFLMDLTVFDGPSLTGTLQAVAAALLLVQGRQCVLKADLKQ